MLKSEIIKKLKNQVVIILKLDLPFNKYSMEFLTGTSLDKDITSAKTVK
ncbi:hypothetical protein [Methanococcus maripaludis]|uniref:Uncharacterized protein n=1 Tax=Methanococcus maripaludis TaxID=39152 RepID=A0A7J9PMF0_METMI|nr:hypothetical protein [Methanococcus maripaludis]MBA2864402.1 hypothetical protein [Methanococcus maripaludis]